VLVTQRRNHGHTRYRATATCHTPFLVLACLLSLSGPTAAAEAPTELIRLEGNCLRDGTGRYLRLGATYMQALRRTKFDRARYRGDLAFLSEQGFDFIRVLSMVGWDGLSIVPPNFRAPDGSAAWDDYWQQFGDMIDIAYDEFGLRTELTIFADAQHMPDARDRQTHLRGVLDHIRGREHKVILLEVGNEAWQNGFPGDAGVEDLRACGQYLAERTDVPVALSAPHDVTEPLMRALYGDSAADVATAHWTRDVRMDEGGWLAVRDPWRAVGWEDLPPIASNEPIGPGSSVSSEDDPVKLVAAAAAAWMAGAPMYVFHSSAGVYGHESFETMAGVRDFVHVLRILPPDIANWQPAQRGDDRFPLVTYADDQPDRWWQEVPQASRGATFHAGCVRDDAFYTLCIGVHSGGVEIEARFPMRIDVIHPLTGEIVREAVLAHQERLLLPQGPGAYVIRGRISTD